MSDKLKNLIEAALMLDEQERAEFASLLLETLDEDDQIVDQAEIDSAWLAEIKRRVASRDERKMIPLDQAMKMAKARQMP